MTFGLISWLKSRYPDLDYEVPLWFPSKEQPDLREWLITNGLGGYSSSTVSGAHRRRYHGLLVSAMNPPFGRFIALAKANEIVTIDGKEYELASNHWQSGVTSPTGYKRLEAFTILPVPTWVYELDGHYLIKQLTLKRGKDELVAGYTFVPASDKPPAQANISVKLLVGWRSHHDEVKGSSDERYPQFLSAGQNVIILNDQTNRLCLTWSSGNYVTERQWWWDFQWPEETARGQPDHEDLFLAGSLKANLDHKRDLVIAASVEKPSVNPDSRSAAQSVLKRQKTLISTAELPRGQKQDLLVLAADQFIVHADSESADLEDQVTEDQTDTYVVEGFHWFNSSGRAALMSLPGLTLSTRQFGTAKAVIRTLLSKARQGILPNRFVDDTNDRLSVRIEYLSADTTLWWAWALHHYYKATKDREFVREQLPALIEAAGDYLEGTNDGIVVDTADGLLRTSAVHDELSWMDTKVEGNPITPRSGKAVELSALWYNFLSTICQLAKDIAFEDPELERLEKSRQLCGLSMTKFWNDDKNSLFDVIECQSRDHSSVDDSCRPNQIFAISLPYRAFSKEQERQILKKVQEELLTPVGLRTLSSKEPGYQRQYGCGFAHADQYHRDLSYHQGTTWAWLLGHYFDALVNVEGASAATAARIAQLLEPLLKHLTEDAGLGSLSEIFDGDSPYNARGCIAHAPAVAEALRWLAWLKDWQ